MNTEQIRNLILTGLPTADVQVSSPDGTHFEAVVVSADFEGKRSVQRHQMVYKALGSHMGNEIHALSFRTYTPEEWQAAS